MRLNNALRSTSRPFKKFFRGLDVSEVVLSNCQRMLLNRTVSGVNRAPFLVRYFWTKRKSNFGKYNIVEPGLVSEQKRVPDHIIKPAYHETGEPDKPALITAEIKDDRQIEGMRKSCKLAADILRKVDEHIKVGQTTDQLDTIVHDLVVNAGAYPSPLNYRHFPKSICTSVNNVACHGIPDDRPLQDGDIVNVDITVYYQGYHGDCSKTFLIGNVDQHGRDLVKATEICLTEAIANCEPGREFRNIGKLIQKNARKLGFNVVPAFVGHGIGSYFHGPPDIYHVENDYPGQMQPGMTFTIEPVLTQGGPEVAILDDGWTAVTLDFARTAQFEHTVLITERGVEILT